MNYSITSNRVEGYFKPWGALCLNMENPKRPNYDFVAWDQDGERFEFDAEPGDIFTVGLKSAKSLPTLRHWYLLLDDGKAELVTEEKARELWPDSPSAKAKHPQGKTGGRVKGRRRQAPKKTRDKSADKAMMLAGFCSDLVRDGYLDESILDDRWEEFKQLLKEYEYGLN